MPDHGPPPVRAVDPGQQKASLALALLGAMLPFFGDQSQAVGNWLLELPVLIVIAMLWRLPAVPAPLLLRFGLLWTAWTLVCTAPHLRWIADLISRQGFLASLATFSSPTTADEMYALRRAMDAVTALLLAYVIFRLTRQRLRHLFRPARWLAVGAVLTAAYGLAVYVLELARGGPLDWPVVGPIHLGGAHITINTVVFSPRLSSIFGNPGWYAEFAVLTLPVLLAAVCAGSPRVQRWAAGGLFLQLTSVLLTWSRAAWLAAAVAVVVFVWKTRTVASSVKAVTGPLVGAGAAALAAAGIIVGVGVPFARDIAWVRLTGPAGWGDRLDLWVQAWSAGLAAPLFGHGAGGFHRFYVAEVPSWAPAFRPLHGTAHSFWLETLVTSGWPGLLLVVLLCGTGLMITLRPGRAEETRESRIVRAAAGAALAASVVLAIFQHITYVRVIELLWWAWIGVAAAVALPPARPPAPRTAARPAGKPGATMMVSRSLRHALTGPTGRRTRLTLAGVLVAGIVLRILLTTPAEPGWYPWERDSAGRAFHWSRGVGRLPMTVSARYLHLPLALFRPGLAADPVTVHLTVRPRIGMGTLFTQTVEMDRSDWRTVSMDLATLRGQNVWLEVEPASRFSPAQLWDSNDRRWLGVAVGRPEHSGVDVGFTQP